MMVMNFGMSEALGPRSYGSGSGSLFLGRELYDARDYSESAAEEIDNEVRRILQTAYHRAKNILMENRDKLDKLSEILIEHETLDRQMFEEIMEGKLPSSLQPAPGAPAPA